MYYRFNSFTGRLIGSAHIQPYFPISVKLLNKNDPPKIVFQDASVKPVTQTSTRYSSTNKSDLYAALKKKQALFQKNDGVPIHLKGGPVDKVLYGITLALCAVGTVLSLQTLFVMAYPKKA
ncbi:cytochrome c oxidase subunit 7A1, mitochondrial-like [Zootermopsis nevadensis]|uniref:Cytochrome c oxidase subunit 7A-related protein, mitochondrial n=1 Tax=Zootermopsis nevadensis TaxID=136037 RepID=A0A067R7U9_ZOONE|nr:cytochrome c oxidase subunit 7A1, mitochondrial-like [Zootermopsis nevadensis]KDR19493.1 Cytochrome c oxidase subunit 7A-related protein, mitochondrial [Zootermopsis nevadensis]